MPKASTHHRWLRWSFFVALLLVFILGPFVLFERSLTTWSETFLSDASSRGALAVGTILLLGVDVLLPIPSSLVAAAAVSFLGAIWGGTAVFFGLTLAAWVGYGVGRLGGTPLASRIAGPEELARARASMDKHGYWVLALSRGVPVLAEASTLFAGTVKQSTLGFGLVTLLGNLGVALAYATMGLLDLPSGLDVVGPFVFALAVPALGWVTFRRLLARRPPV